MFVIAQLSC